MLWIPVAFFSGVLVGGFAGGFIGVNGAKKQIADLKKRLAEAEKASSDLLEKFDKTASEALEGISRRLENDMTDSTSFVAKPPKSSISSSESVVEPKNLHEREEEAKMVPFRISEEAFRNEYATVEDDTLTYFVRDGVLSDDGGNRVEIAHELIGDIYDNLIDGVYDDEDSIYVHNESLGQNFRIDIDHNSRFAYT